MEESYCITAILKNEANRDGCYNVTFPGIEGVTTSGDSVNGARESAVTELGSYFKGLSRRERLKFATPRTVDTGGLESDEQVIWAYFIHEVDENSDREKEKIERKNREEARLNGDFQIEEEIMDAKRGNENKGMLEEAFERKEEISSFLRRFLK